MERGLVSVDDLIETLTVIAREGDKALRDIAGAETISSQRLRFRVYRMKWEALEAIERAERGEV